MFDTKVPAHKNHTTPLGIIEGFFGREWSWENRAAYANFLSRYGFDFYIYAPKSDAHLRKHWQENWPQGTKTQLHSLRDTYRTAEISFGIGLSPHEIYLDASRDQRELLKHRTHQINDLSPDIFCILFDDMRGDIPNLAQLQIDIAHQAANESTAKKIIFCPTYYSFDPVLQKVFGMMPENYWRSFAKNLDPNIDMFWTGEKVCSTQYPPAHLDEVTDLLGRKPFLWDNYPVNDGAVKSNLLHLRAVDQTHSLLEGKLAGHALNPMNQPWLSQIPLASLPAAYESKSAYDPAAIFAHLCSELCGEELAQELKKDIAGFQEIGLKNMADEEKSLLREKYKKFQGNPFAQEIIDWLNDEYQFDPACLTE